MKTVGADSKKVPVTFKVGEFGDGCVFLSVRDDDLIPNVDFSFSLREGVSYEEAQALVDHLKKHVTQFGCTRSVVLDPKGGDN